MASLILAQQAGPAEGKAVELAVTAAMVLGLPQWLALRHQADRHRAAATMCSGFPARRELE